MVSLKESTHDVFLLDGSSPQPMEGVEYTGPGLPHDATTETSDNASTVDMTEENQNSSMTRRSNPNRSARSTQSTGSH
ncbi:hypothetical protein GLOIN_2v1589012 [Rhizophagus irregularis DAOM 181602=DAOM 197198]|nr:hypothetical protein GLOIN_2v1589012 [Rhizophagus irregularis DAOM 181602=DAOM 197198]